MSSSETPYINDINVTNIKEQILQKQKSTPYYATTKESTSVLTDYDTFPYPRYFRGVPRSTKPIIAEREAGWRPRHDKCYHVDPPCTVPQPYPNHCFQAPCSTVYPCYPEYLTKYSDKEALDLILNNTCTIQYS